MLYFTVCIWPDRPEQTVDPDETPQNAASHQGLHCLPLIQLIFDKHWVVNSTCSFKIKYGKQLS